MKTVGRRALVFGVVCLIAGPALQACRKEEQNRLLLFEKGTYLGPADELLTPAQLDLLRQRASKQAM